MDFSRRLLFQRFAALIATLTSKGNRVATVNTADLASALSAATQGTSVLTETAASAMSPEVASMVGAMRQVTLLLGRTPSNIEGLEIPKTDALPQIGDDAYKAMLEKARMSLANGSAPPQEVVDYFVNRLTQYNAVDELLDGAKICVKDGLYEIRPIIMHLRDLVVAQDRINKFLTKEWAPTQIAVNALQKELEKVLEKHKIPKQVWLDYIEANEDVHMLSKFSSVIFESGQIESILGQLWKDLKGVSSEDAAAHWFGHMALRLENAGVRFSNGSWNQQSYDARQLPQSLQCVLEAISSAKHAATREGKPPLSFADLTEVLNRWHVDEDTALKIGKLQIAKSSGGDHLEKVVKPKQLTHAEIEEERREKNHREALMPDPSTRAGNDYY